MLVYIAQDGVTTTDLFRRSGSQSDLKLIMSELANGKAVHFTDYNFYTLASVTKVEFERSHLSFEAKPRCMFFQQVLLQAL